MTEIRICGLCLYCAWNKSDLIVIAKTLGLDDIPEFPRMAHDECFFA
jgi:hypothetical protein